MSGFSNRRTDGRASAPPTTTPAGRRCPALQPGSPYAAKGRVAEVQSLFAHVYREASVTRHAPLITVPFETKFEVIAEPAQQKWIQVRLPDDRSGWVQSGDVAFDAQAAQHSRNDRAEQALSGPAVHLGRHVELSGTIAPGFTQMLCRRRGIHMPRDAQPQAEWSGVAPVERKDLQPGDLLYFGSSEKHITHTGLYIGDGKFINATTYETPMVRIDNLDDPHWTRLLVAMRRVK